MDTAPRRRRGRPQKNFPFDTLCRVAAHFRIPPPPHGHLTDDEVLALLLAMHATKSSKGEARRLREELGRRTTAYFVEGLVNAGLSKADAAAVAVLARTWSVSSAYPTLAASEKLYARVRYGGRIVKLTRAFFLALLAMYQVVGPDKVKELAEQALKRADLARHPDGRPLGRSPDSYVRQGVG